MKQFQSRYKFYRQSKGKTTGSCLSNVVKISVQESEGNLLWEDSGKLRVNFLTRSVDDIFILSNSEKTMGQLITEEYVNRHLAKKFTVQNEDEN